MPRSLSAALQTELAKTITSVGYFVQIVLTVAGTQRWSNIGPITWNALSWSDIDFRLEGLDFNSEVDLTGRLMIQNLDGVAGALFGNPAEHLYEAVITAYQFARGALGVNDVPLIAQLSIDNCDITPQWVTLSLTDKNTDAQFSPRRRICPSEGFNFATPAGAVIAWGNEIITLEAENG